MAISFDKMSLTAPVKTGELSMVHPADIVYDPEHNLSRHYPDDHKVDRLVASYRKLGKVLQPVRLVKIKGEDKTERFEIVCGTRRVRAAQIYVKENPDFRVPAVIVSDRTLSAEERLLINIEENNNREDPSPVDKAFAMLALKEQHGYDVKRIAEVYRCSQNNVRNYLRLTAVDPKILRRVHDGLLPYMDAIALNSVSDSEKVNEALTAVDEAHAETTVTEEKPDGAPAETPKSSKPKQPSKGEAGKKSKAAVKAAIKGDGKSKSMTMAELRKYLSDFRTGIQVDILRMISGEISTDDFTDITIHRTK